MIGPHVVRYLTSEKRLERLRKKEERRRKRDEAPHTVTYFHGVGDPYSALVCQYLERFLARYAVQLDVHLVGEPDEAAAPQPELLKAWGRLDAGRLARRLDLRFPEHAAQPRPALTDLALRLHARLIHDGLFPVHAPGVELALWRGDLGSLQSLLQHHGAWVMRDAQKARKQGDMLLKKLGHYSPGTLHYGGEFYWGVDRLHYLEDRLKGLGLRVGDTEGGRLAEPAPDDLPATAPARGAIIDIYASLRSPYTYLALERVHKLAERYEAQIRLNMVLPMVMRGLPIPKEKRWYILADAAREARRLGIPFGKIADPVGAPAERGLAIAIHQGRENMGFAWDFVLSFMRGVWSEGIDAGSDSGLRKICERAHIDWSKARAWLEDDAWRVEAEANREELFRNGLWGVPSFRIGEFVAWGQDRLWQVEDELERLGRTGG